MRKWMNLFEAAPAPNELDEALWWVIRYVSGSANDPEWDWGNPNEFDMNSAMEYAARYIGNEKSSNIPLYRYIVVPKKVAMEMQETKLLQPNNLAFQSFTFKGVEAAKEIGEEIVWHKPKGHVGIVVSVTPPAPLVLFGVEDVKRQQRKQGIGELYLQWQDWEHQGEVLVKVTKPLKLDSVTLV